MTTAALNRAYALLDIKSFDDDKREITGIATTPTPDRFGDIIEPKGAVFALPLPLIWQHKSDQPVGNVIKAKVSDNGIEITAKFESVDEPASLKDELDRAWAKIKAKLVRGLSIGFRSLESSRIKDTFSERITKWEWVELSCVTIPANSECTIQTVKSADALVRAASGKEHVVVRLNLNLPGDSGPTKSKGKSMTLQEQIAAFEAKRAASIARMTAIMDKAGETGSTLDAAQQEEYDTLDTEIKSIDGHLVRLRAHEKRIVMTATSITPETGTDPKKSSEARGGIVQVKSNLPKGTLIARYAIALYNAKGDHDRAADLAKKHYPDHPELELCLRAAVAAMNTTHATAASPLIPAAQQMQGEFLELLRPATLVGRIPGLRRVPFNITIPAQTGGGTYTWVGEGIKKPVSALAFSSVTLRWAKISGIIVMTKELMRFSNPAAEAIVRDDMIKGTAKYIDEQFVDPTVAEVTNISPASITNGATTSAASGTTAAAFRTDMQTRLGNFITNNEDPTDLVILMSSSVALNLSLRLTDLGTREFPDISANGGSILGLPVIVSQSVGARIIIVKASDILLADDGPVEIDVSEEASVVMDSAPQASPQTTELVSFWQHNYIGLRLDKFITWKKARTSSVEYISNAVYGG